MFRKQYAPIVILLAISTISFANWLINPILTHGDWGFHFAITTKEWVHFSGIWTSQLSFGGVNLVLSELPFFFLFGIFGHLGLNSNIADKFIFFLPIIVFGAVANFYLSRKIIKSIPGSITASLVFSYNTYFMLLSTSHVNLLLAWVLAPSLILIFIKTFEDRKLSFGIITALLGFVLAFLDFRSFYVTSIGIFLYLIYLLFIAEESFATKKYILFLMQKMKISFTVLAIFVLLNCYWLLGLFSIDAVIDNSIFDRNLFGNSYMQVENAITMFHSFWTGSAFESFTTHPAPLYFSLVPMFAFLGLWLNRKNKKVLFFGIVALVGILLTKQVDVPFPELYPWLFEHMPGFKAFREASKFYFLIALGYSVLIGSFVAWLWEEWVKKSRKPKVESRRYKEIFLGSGSKSEITKGVSGVTHEVRGESKLRTFFSVKPFVVRWRQYVAGFLTALTATIFLINTVPFITGEIGRLFVSRHIPKDYIKLNNFVDNQNNFFRAIWLPRGSRWGIYTNMNPKINLVDTVNSTWDVFIDEAKFSNSPADKRDRIVSVPKESYANSLFDFGAIKYVVVPLEDRANDDNFYVHYGMSKDFYVQTMDSLDYLERIDIGMEEVVVYENKGYKPYFFALTELYEFESTENLDEKYEFVTNELGGEFAFVVSGNNKSLGLSDHSLYKRENKSLPPPDGGVLPLQRENQNVTTKVYQVFENLTPGDMREGSVAARYSNLSGEVVLYSDEGKQTVYLSETAAGEENRELVVYKVQDNNLRYSFSNNKSLPQQAEYSLYERENIPPFIKEVSRYVGMEDLVYQLPTSTITTELARFPVSSGTEYVYRIASTTIEKLGTQKLPRSLGTITEPITLYSLAPNNVIPNGGFEHGLWSDKVGDCNAYDDRGILDITLGTRDKEKVESNNNENLSPFTFHLSPVAGNSLELHATRHIACTGPGVLPVTENKQYLLSFAYQSDNAKNAGYYLGFNDEKGTKISERLPVTGTQWHTFNKTITIPRGATSVSLVVYSYSQDEETNIITRYDNFGLYELPSISNRFYLVTSPQGIKSSVPTSRDTSFMKGGIENSDSPFPKGSTPQYAGGGISGLQKPESIEFDLINPTKKRVHVAGAATPFFLAMSESYHPQWQAQLDPTSREATSGTVTEKINEWFRSWVPWVHPDRVSDENHFELNTFLNAWYIDPAELCEGQEKREKEQGESKNESVYKNLRTQKTVDSLDEWLVKSGCILNPDGSYDIDLIIEFFPQRWFYLGLLISGATLLGCIVYLIYDWRKRIANKEIRTKVKKER